MMPMILPYRLLRPRKELHLQVMRHDLARQVATDTCGAIQISSWSTCSAVVMTCPYLLGQFE